MDSETFRATVSKLNRKFFIPRYPLNGVFLLGDNFYPRGISRDLSIRDPQFNLFSDVLAGSAPDGLTFYPILGNHDWMGDVNAQVGFSLFDARWHMPALYHFKRFNLEERVNVCVWFIDTEHFFSDETQKRWLRSSLATETTTCTWTIVNGHYPVFTGGEYTRCNSLERFRNSILPILNEYQVDMYLSGHEHQSQILKADDHNTVFVVAGSISDMRGERARGHANLRWIDSRTVGFAEIIVSSNELKIVFHRSYGGVDAEPFCRARLYKPDQDHPVDLTLTGC